MWADFLLWSLQVCVSAVRKHTPSSAQWFIQLRRYYIYIFIWRINYTLLRLWSRHVLHQAWPCASAEQQGIHFCYVKQQNKPLVGSFSNGFLNPSDLSLCRVFTPHGCIYHSCWPPASKLPPSSTKSVCWRAAEWCLYPYDEQFNYLSQRKKEPLGFSWLRLFQGYATCVKKQLV